MLEEQTWSLWPESAAVPRVEYSIIPVAVRRMFILNVSPEMTWAPELEPVGDRRLVMA